MTAPSRKSAGKARQRSKAGSVTRAASVARSSVSPRCTAERNANVVQSSERMTMFSVRAAHLEPDATGGEIDRRFGRRFGPIGAPDAVNRPARRNKAEGGMKLQC